MRRTDLLLHLHLRVVAWMKCYRDVASDLPLLYPFTLCIYDFFSHPFFSGAGVYVVSFLAMKG